MSGEETSWTEHYADELDDLRDACALATEAIEHALNRLGMSGAGLDVDAMARRWAVGEIERLLTDSAVAEFRSHIDLGDDEVDDPGEDGA